EMQALVALIGGGFAINTAFIALIPILKNRKNQQFKYWGVL
ncbi:22761_t:CDS:1, partial [Dentiscutata erythropus]